MLHIDLPSRSEILHFAATFGAIDTLIVAMDVVVPCTLDEESGAVVSADSPGADTYDVVDEIVSRALKSRMRCVAARRDDLPGDGALAAILRYAI